MGGCTTEGRNLRGFQFVASSLLTIAQLFSPPFRGTSPSLLQNPLFFQHVLLPSFLCGWTFYRHAVIPEQLREIPGLPGTLASFAILVLFARMQDSLIERSLLAIANHVSFPETLTLIWFLVEVKLAIADHVTSAL